MGTFPTEEMELTRLLVVSDVDRSRAWYVDVSARPSFAVRWHVQRAAAPRQQLAAARDRRRADPR